MARTGVTNLIAVRDESAQNKGGPHLTNLPGQLLSGLIARKEANQTAMAKLFSGG
jgi:hypothetical protein